MSTTPSLRPAAVASRLKRAGFVLTYGDRRREGAHVTSTGSTVVTSVTFTQDDETHAAKLARDAAAVLLQAGYEVARSDARLTVTLPADEATESVEEPTTPAPLAPATPLEAAALAGLYAVVTGTAWQVVGMYESGERADEVAETYRAAGEGASVIRPCGHAWDRYAHRGPCSPCGTLRDLRQLDADGRHLIPSSRATLAAGNARDARMTALRELQEAELEVPTSIPGEAEIAAGHAAGRTSPAPVPVSVPLEDVTTAEAAESGLAELQRLADRYAPTEIARAARSVLHVLAVLRGAADGRLLVTSYAHITGEPVVAYFHKRGDRLVHADASAAFAALDAARYLRHDAGTFRVTRRGRRLLQALPTLIPADHR